MERDRGRRLTDAGEVGRDDASPRGATEDAAVAPQAETREVDSGDPSVGGSGSVGSSIGGAGAIPSGGGAGIPGISPTRNDAGTAGGHPLSAPDVPEPFNLPDGGGTASRSTEGCSASPEGPRGLYFLSPDDFAELAALRCEVLDWDLYFYESEFVDLAGFEDLRELHGVLTLARTTNLASLEGLKALELITGDVRIVRADALTSFAGLESLREVRGSFRVEKSGLETFEGLEGLGSIGGSLNVVENERLATLQGLDSLSSIGAALNVTDNPDLTVIGGLTNLSTVGDEISLVGNSLTSLAELDGAITRNVTLRWLPSLVSLEGLGALTVLDDLTIEGTSAFTDLRGLERLERIEGTFRISSTKLESLEGLSLESVGSLRVDRNDALVELGEVLGTTLTALHVSYNDSLERVALGPELLSLGELEILRNPRLELVAFDGLTDVENQVSVGYNGDQQSVGLAIRFEALENVGTELRISNNAALASLELPRLQTVETLSISENDGAFGLDLSSLSSVSSVEVRYNPNLPQCLVEALFPAEVCYCEGNDEAATCDL